MGRESAGGIVSKFNIMDKVKEAIEAGIITYSDIVEFLEANGDTVVIRERLEFLEKLAINHPG